MSAGLENFLRGAGVAVAIAVLTYIANVSNISNVVGPQWTFIVSSIAAAVLAAIDGAKSPSGTVGFGLIGSKRY